MLPRNSAYTYCADLRVDGAEDVEFDKRVFVSMPLAGATAPVTLAAAVGEGLRCQLLLEERVPGSYKPTGSGNNFLFRLLGVERVKVTPGGSPLLQIMGEMAEEFRTQGRQAYVIPTGGSNPVGATGYVACAEEILAQSFDLGIRIDRVVCASGSGGTHAGLVAGFYGNNSGIPVVGVNVSRKKGAQEELIYDLALRIATHVGVAGTLPRETVRCFDEYVGPGYSLPTPSMIEAVQLLARTEAILLDPVYTGKAMAGLIDLVRKGYFKKGEHVLFVHTGGSPALYAYEEVVLGSPA